MSAVDNKTNVAKTGPRYRWFWFGCFAGLMGLLDLADRIMGRQRQPGDPTVLNLIDDGLFSFGAVFPTAMLAIAVHVLKSRKKDLVLSGSSFLWLAYGILSIAVMVLLVLVGSLLKFSDAVMPFMFLAGICGGPVLVFLAHFFCGKRTKPAIQTLSPDSKN